MGWLEPETAAATRQARMVDAPAEVATRKAAAAAVEAAKRAAEERMGLTRPEVPERAVARLRELREDDARLAAREAEAVATIARLRGSNADEEARRLIEGLAPGELKSIDKAERDLADLRQQRAMVGRAIQILARSQARLDYDAMVERVPAVRARAFAALRAFDAALAAAAAALETAREPLEDYERLFRTLDAARDRLPTPHPSLPMSSEAIYLFLQWRDDLLGSHGNRSQVALWRELAQRVGVFDEVQ